MFFVYPRQIRVEIAFVLVKFGTPEGSVVVIGRELRILPRCTFIPSTAVKLKSRKFQGNRQNKANPSDSRFPCNGRLEIPGR